MVYSMYCGRSDGRTAFTLFRFGGRPVNNIFSFLEPGDSGLFRVSEFVTSPRSASFIHSLFTREAVSGCVISDELVPCFGHSFF